MESSGQASKTAIITGASRGIGRSVALRLAADCPKQVLVHRQDVQAMADVKTALVDAGAEVVVLRGDIGDATFANDVCQAALESFGRLDLLVNNAAVAHDGLLPVLADEKLEEMAGTNILGLVRLTRTAIQPMLSQRKGCIINLSSALAQRPQRGNAVYAGTKGFVESFTKALAIELGRKKIRVLAVAPGVVDTAMSREVRATGGDRVTGQIALGRIGTPEEVADLIAFLASDKADYISGSVIGIDGGFGASG